MPTRSEPSLLVLGGSVLQLPAITAARARGLRVAVADMNPAAPGADLADDFFPVSTYDEDAVCALALDYRPSGVVTLGTDRPVRSVARACAALGLPGPTPQAALAATDKHVMAARFAEHGLAAPAFLRVPASGEIPERVRELGLPLVSKPLDSSGSRGVVRVDDWGALADAVSYSASFSSAGEVLLEAFVSGQELSLEMLCVGEEATIVAVTEKSTTGAPHFVETGHAQPAALPDATLAAVTELSLGSARALGLSDCAAHVELIVSDDGPQLLEVGARLGGDFIATHLTPLSTGVDMVDAIIAIALGEQPRTAPAARGVSAVTFGHLPTTPEAATLTALRPTILASSGAQDVGVLSATSSAHPTSSVERGAYAVGFAADRAGAVGQALAALADLGATPYPISTLTTETA